MITFGRNLFRILGNQRVVAFITAFKAEDAIAIYRDKCGRCAEVTAEQMSWGYPEDVCKIY
jgi:hypothetical protein